MYPSRGPPQRNETTNSAASAGEQVHKSCDEPSPFESKNHFAQEAEMQPVSCLSAHGCGCSNVIVCTRARGDADNCLTNLEALCAMRSGLVENLCVCVCVCV